MDLNHSTPSLFTGASVAGTYRSVVYLQDTVVCVLCGVLLGELVVQHDVGYYSYNRTPRSQVWSRVQSSQHRLTRSQWIWNMRI